MKKMNEAMSANKAVKLYKKHGLLMLDDEEGKQAYDALYNAGYTMKKNADGDVGHCIELDRMHENFQDSLNGENGDFIKALAKAIQQADNKNRAKLAKAFPDEVKEFEKWYKGDKSESLRRRVARRKSVNEISDELADKVQYKRGHNYGKVFSKYLDAPTVRGRANKVDKEDKKLQNNLKLNASRDTRHGVTNTVNGRMPIDKARNEKPMYPFSKGYEDGFKKAKNESLAESILREAHSALAINEGEAGELTSWQFSARGFSKAMLGKQPTFGTADIRCIIHENDNGKLVGTAVASYEMNKAQIEEAIKKALAENGFKAVTISELTNLY